LPALLPFAELLPLLLNQQAREAEQLLLLPLLAQQGVGC
jgi:hypothetical protein